MVQVSYSDVFQINHDREHEEEIQVGDLVRTGPNLYPHYTVIAVNGDKAWVRNEIDADPTDDSLLTPPEVQEEDLEP